MVKVLCDSLYSQDADSRLESITWLRERSTPAAYQVLRRSSHDSSNLVRQEAFLGLALSSPGYRLDAFQMRHLEPAERAGLIRVASERNLIDHAALLSIAMNSSALPIERAEAMLALGALDRPVSHDRWLPLLGASDERTRLLAALSVITDAPESRAVAIAQDTAVSALRQSVVDASQGRVLVVVDVLEAVRHSPGEPVSDFAGAILDACSQSKGQEQSFAAHHALLTLLAVDPDRPGLSQHWQGVWNSQDAKHAQLAFGALEAADARDAKGLAIPRWFAKSMLINKTESDAFVIAVGELLEAITNDAQNNSEPLLGVLTTGSASADELVLRMILRLPEQHQAQVLIQLLAGISATNLDPMQIRLAARGLAAIDPIGAQVALVHAHESNQEGVSIALVLAGVWLDEFSTDARLGLMHSLWLAEQETDGPRTQSRAELADQLSMIVDERLGFTTPVRAEAAWLMLMLRSQTSEAMANLPDLATATNGDLSQSPTETDSLRQWAQMQYP